MAMRPRGRTGGQTPRQPMQQTYVRYKPKSQWKYEDDATLLLINLPVFVREQVRVMFTYDDSNALCLKVQGQRPLEGGRWSQFTEIYRVPETCDASKIQSQFERGVLTIVMPKLVVTKQPDPRIVADEAKAMREALSSKETASWPSPRKGKDKVSAAPDVASTSAAAMEKAKGEEEYSQKGTQDRVPDQKLAAAAREKQREEKTVEAPVTTQKATSEEKTKKGTQEEIPAPKVEAAATEEKTEEKIVEDSITTQKETIEEKSQKGTQDIETSSKATFPEEKPGDVVQKPLVQDKETTEKSKEPTAPEAAVAPKTEEKDIKDDKSKKPEGDLEEKREESSIAEKSKEMKDESASAKEGQPDEKQLLLNMGIAALVILGLGVYIFYTAG